MTDYLDRDALRALDIDEAAIDRLLRSTPLSGHDGRPVVEADRLDELLEMLHREEGGDDHRRRQRFRSIRSCKGTSVWAWRRSRCHKQAKCLLLRDGREFASPRTPFPNTSPMTPATSAF